MGYRRPAKTYHITWDDGDLAGLEIRAGGLSVGKMLSLGKAAAAIPADFSGSIATAVEPLLRQFAVALKEWNLEDDGGNPVPAEYAVCVVSGKPGEPDAKCTANCEGDDGIPCEYTGIISQDLPFIIPVIMRWMTAVAGVDNPLPGTSSSGGTSPEESLALANSSTNLKNS